MPVFSKLPTTHAQQLALLQSRGLAVPDEPFALHCLKHHNYYRLSAYRFTITETGNPDKFLPGMTFDHLWGLYCFDRNLRLLVTEAVKRLEISTRSPIFFFLASILSKISRKAGRRSFLIQNSFSFSPLKLLLQT